MSRRLSVLVSMLVLMVAVVGCAGAPASTPENTPTEEPTSMPQPTSTPEPSVFRIVPDESEVRFAAVEEIKDKGFNTVIGTTSAVEGEITADYANPTATTLGLIRVDISTLVTDNALRNSSIKNIIVPTFMDEFQYAEFAATEIIGLPDEVTLNEAFTFQIIGDMTINGVTTPLTFEASVTPISETRLEGTASGEFSHIEHKMTIPDAMVLLGVNEMVKVEIDFVAERN